MQEHKVKKFFGVIVLQTTYYCQVAGQDSVLFFWSYWFFFKVLQNINLEGIVDTY